MKKLWCPSWMVGCCALALLAMRPAVSGAATVNWLGGEGNWTNTAKWSTGALPGTADNPYIKASALCYVSTANAVASIVTIMDPGSVNTLVITNGGSLTALSRVQLYPTSAGQTTMLVMAGGTLTTKDLQVPRSGLGVGVLNIYSGEVKVTNLFEITSEASSVGEFTMTGGSLTATSWNFGLLNASGCSSTSTISGGSISVALTTSIGLGANQKHYVTQNGGVVNIQSNLTIGGTWSSGDFFSIYTLNGGVLNVGGIISGRNTYTTNRTALVLNGGVLSCWRYHYNWEYMTNSGAALSPGYTNIGYMSIFPGSAKPYVETTNTCEIHIQLAGTNHPTEGVAHDYDHLDFDSGSSATFRGQLVVSFLNDFKYRVTSNDVFYIIQCGTLAGAFANVASGQRLEVQGTKGGSFMVTYPVTSHPEVPFMDQAVMLSNYMPPSRGTVFSFR